jgi:putative endonuclease
MDAAATGRLGEDCALLFLRACGLDCRARRWRRGGGEIDLVMTAPGLLVFVEVKTRGPGSLARAPEAVTPVQLARLRRLARRWCHEHDTGGAALRLDVVAVDLAGPGRGLVLRHFPDVT